MLENITVIRKPNCTEEGLGSGACTVCGAEHIEEKIPTNDVHSFTNVVVREATCTDYGEGKNVCELCQYSEPCRYELKDHTYSGRTVLAEPDCTHDGSVQYTCTICGFSAEETIAAKGHSWTGATCLTAGKCSVCGATGKKGNHSYEVTVKVDAKETFAGYQIKECNVCGTKQKDYYTKSYTYNLDVVAAEVAAYAKQKGFRPVIESFHDGYVQFAHSVMNLEQERIDQNGLIQTGRNLVDKVYNQLTENGRLGNRVLHIHVYYTQSGAVGMGYFGIYLKTSFYDTE